MASYSEYYSDKVVIRYFENEGTIYLAPIDKKTTKKELRRIKEEIETALDVSNSNFTESDGKPSFVLDMSQNSNQQIVKTFLQSRFHGGDEVVDAAGLSKEGEDEQQPPMPPPGQEGQMPPPPPGQEEQVPLNASRVFTVFYESTYRTAEYWNVLSKVTGIGKQNITKENILSARKTYTRKPKGKRRDEVLRSLDKAMKYFSRKIRNEMGKDAADEFKDKYRSIGNLVPSDYKSDSSPARSQESTFSQEIPEKSPVDNIKLSDLFKKDKTEKDEYKGFETKE